MELGRRNPLRLSFEPAVVARWQQLGEAARGALDAHLGGRGFIVGDAPTIADKGSLCWCAPEQCHGKVLLRLVNP